MREHETDRVTPNDLRWPRKKVPSAREQAAQALTDLAERAHGDKTLPYAAYLQRLHTLRLVAEELKAEVPNTVFHVRVPRRGKFTGEEKK